MNRVAASSIWVLTGALWCSPTPAQPLPPELRLVLPVASLSGQTTMKYWGFDLYQATLWISPGFVETAYAQSTLALELTYLRDFRSADIAKRSIMEMRRQAPMTQEQEAAWEGQMQALFPDVKAGDRITGVNQPGSGALFWINGHRLGEVRDSAFAKQFFGIWLSPQTSEPQVRRALLAQAKPATSSSAAP